MSVTDLFICHDNSWARFYLSPTPSDEVTRPVALIFIAMLPSPRYFSLDKAVLGGGRVHSMRGFDVSVVKATNHEHCARSVTEKEQNTIVMN